MTTQYVRWEATVVQRVTGPACPGCGCCDSKVIRTETRWGKGSARHRCAHCSSTWSVTVTDADTQDNGTQRAVIYHVLRCPKCDGTRCPVTHTDRPIRHHKCEDCGHPFQSVER